MHVVLTHSDLDANVCRAVSSAASLGYPRPVLVAMNSKDTSASSKIPMDSLLSNIDTTLAALRVATSGHDDDLVLLANGHSIWFQLRPQVLISRFFSASAIQAASEAHHFGTIVVASRNSNVTADVMFGTAGAVENLLLQLRGMVFQSDEETTLDELLRTVYRKHRSDDLTFTRTEPVFRATHLHMDNNSEFVISRNTSDGRSDWIVHSERFTDSSDYNHISSLPKDITTSRSPFFSLVATDGIDSTETWEQQSLLTASESNRIPALILSDDANKSKEWKNLWFADKLESVLQLRMIEFGEGPVAYAGKRFWWPNQHNSWEYHQTWLSDATGPMKICGGPPAEIC